MLNVWTNKNDISAIPGEVFVLAENLQILQRKAMEMGRPEPAPIPIFTPKNPEITKLQDYSGVLNQKFHFQKLVWSMNKLVLVNKRSQR